MKFAVSLLCLLLCVGQLFCQARLDDGLVLANDSKIIGPKSQRNMLAALGVADPQCEGCDVTMDGETPSEVIFTDGSGSVDGLGSVKLYNPDGTVSFEVTFLIETIANGECVMYHVCSEEYGCTWSVPRVYIEQINSPQGLNWWATITPSWSGVTYTDPTVHPSVVGPVDYFNLNGEVDWRPDPTTRYNCDTSVRYEIWIGNTAGDTTNSTLLISTVVECNKCKPKANQSIFY